jgi:hypothetical protein
MQVDDANHTGDAREGSPMPRLDEGYLLLADISGYTAFVSGVHEAHGEEIESDGSIPRAYPLLGALLDLIVRRLDPPFTLAKLEGDAVFARAPTGSLENGDQVLGILDEVNDDFLRQAAAVRACTDPACTPCMAIADLRLKFVLHHGSYVVEEIAGQEELIGPEVTLVHRLAKNSVEERTGRTSYLLVTEAAADRLPGVLVHSLAHEESYEHLPHVHGRLVTLESERTTG